MRIAKVIVKKSAEDSLKQQFPGLFSNSQIKVEVISDADFNTQTAIEQITIEGLNGKK